MLSNSPSNSSQNMVMISKGGHRQLIIKDSIIQNKNGIADSHNQSFIIESISLHKKVTEAKGMEKDPRNESIFSFSEFEEKESEDCK